MSEVDRAQRSFISYIDRTREYYRAQGYDRPYRWAHFDEVPFTRLTKPLAECRVTLVTTAAERAGESLMVQRAVWSGPTDPPPEQVITQHVPWDYESTHTDDRESFLPIHRVQECVAAGRLGGLAPRFHGVPTEYSQRRTREQDAPEVLRRCREDGVDVALLIPL